jgi:hypothetical protein
MSTPRTFLNSEIPKLSGAGTYVAWSSYVGVLADAFGMRKLLSAPTKGVSIDLALDSQIKLALFNSLEKDALNFFEAGSLMESHAYQIWEALQIQYQKVAYHDIMRHRNLFMRARCDGSFPDFLHALGGHRSCLKALNITLDDEDLKAKVFGEAPESLHQLVELYQTDPYKDKSFAQVSAACLSHLELIASRGELETTSAFVAHSSRRCSHCKRSGHEASACWVLHPEQRQQYRERKAQ